MAEEEKNFQSEIEIVLNSLKKMGHDRKTIGEALGYLGNGIDSAKSRGGGLKLLRALELYQDLAVLRNSISEVHLMPNADLPIDELSDWLSQLQNAATATQKIIFDKISSGGTLRVSKPSSVSGTDRKNQEEQKA